jgi:hypothetical protein
MFGAEPIAIIKSRSGADNARAGGRHHAYTPKARVHLAHLRFLY